MTPPRQPRTRWTHEGQRVHGMSGASVNIEPTAPADTTVHLWAHVPAAENDHDGQAEQAGVSLDLPGLIALLDTLAARIPALAAAAAARTQLRHRRVAAVPDPADQRADVEVHLVGFPAADLASIADLLLAEHTHPDPKGVDPTT